MRLRSPLVLGAPLLLGAPLVLGALFAGLATAGAAQDPVRVSDEGGWLGIRLDASMTVTPTADSAHFEIVITDVYRSGPADLGGVIPGDRVVAVNGGPLLTWEAWLNAVSNLGAGQTLHLTVRRGTGEQDVSIVAGTRPTTLQPAIVMERFVDAQARMSRHIDSLFQVVVDWGDLADGVLSAEQRLWEATRAMISEVREEMDAGEAEQRLRDPMEPPDAGGGGGPGARRIEVVESTRPPLLAPFILSTPVVFGGAFVRDLTPAVGQQYFGVESGVLVTNVLDLSPAAWAGLRSGDVITAIGSEAAGTVMQLRVLLTQAVFPVELTVVREGDRLSIAYPR